MGSELDSRLVESLVERDRGLLRKIWEENKLIWPTAFPAIIFRLSMYGVFVVTQSFIGRIGEVELAGYALVQIILVRFANGLVIGMSSATETLCGQAFGAKQYHMLGIYLQRSWIVNLAITTMLLPMFVFCGPLFKLLGEEDDIANAAEGISLWFIGLLFTFLFSCTTQMFLQAQRKNMMIGLLSPITFIFHVLFSWIFVDELGWGVDGAMSVLCLSRWTSIVFMAIYVFGGWCPNTWTGFSKQALRDIVPILKLSVSSGVMQCVQIWYTSILVFLAGYTSDAVVNISAFSICLNINALQYMMSLGFMVATSVRVSNEIGKGDAVAARFSIKLILGTSVALGGLLCALCLAFGREIPYLFTSDDEVAEAASSLSLLLAIAMLLSSIQNVFSGAVVGIGLQGKVAVINICTYYIIGIPIGCVLAYKANLGIVGIWIGLLSGQVTQVFAIAYLMWRIDWDAEIDKASRRLNRFYTERSGERNPLLAPGS